MQIKCYSYVLSLCILLCTHLVVSTDLTCTIGEPVHVSYDDPQYKSKPFVNGCKSFIHGVISDYHGECGNITSPILVQTLSGEKKYENVVIGKIAKMNINDANEAIESAKNAWSHGQGVWPQMSLNERILTIEKIVAALKEKRDEIANVLVWEIAKSVEDAYSEFGTYCMY